MKRACRALASAFAALACVVWSAGARDAQPMAAAHGARPMDGDVAADFACEVDMRLEIPVDEQAAYAARLDATFAAAAIPIAELAPQHVLVVDRDAQVQAALLYRTLPGGGWRFEGAVPVSTGLPGTFEHFATPVGVFAHSLDSLDFRAEGTLNENGILGYGRKAMRVYDFGWVAQVRGWGDHAMGTMRLQVHSTDPAQLEPWLGAPRSKGCIRVPASFDDFMDRRGVLDADYEQALAEGREFWVLRADREATRWPGRYLVVVDSGRSARPPWSHAPNGRTRRTPFAQECRARQPR